MDFKSAEKVKKRLNEPVIKKKTEDEGTSLTTAGSVCEDASHPGGPSHGHPHPQKVRKQFLFETFPDLLDFPAATTRTYEMQVLLWQKSLKY